MSVAYLAVAYLFFYARRKAPYITYVEMGDIFKGVSPRDLHYLKEAAQLDGLPDITLHFHSYALQILLYGFSANYMRSYDAKLVSIFVANSEHVFLPQNDSERLEFLKTIDNLDVSFCDGLSILDLEANVIYSPEAKMTAILYVCKRAAENYSMNIKVMHALEKAGPNRFLFYLAYGVAAGPPFAGAICLHEALLNENYELAASCLGYLEADEVVGAFDHLFGQSWDTFLKYHIAEHFCELDLFVS